MFQNTYDQDRTLNLYPNKQDTNFLGFDREADRWKVDASGIRLYASGISVELDYLNDSVSIWSASGTQSIQTWVDNPVGTFDADPMRKPLIKKQVFYDASDRISEVREALIATASGSPCVIKLVTYNDNDDISYIIETYGTW